MLKKTIVLIALSCCLPCLKAQEKNNVKLGFDAGFILLPGDDENLGLFFNVESKVKASENIFLGLRFGIAINSHTFENNDAFQFSIDEASDNGMVSFVPTIDYYPEGYIFRPFVGAGIGYYWLPSPVDVFPAGVVGTSANIMEGEVDNRIGLLLRGGFEKRRLRVGLEYSFLPKADLELPDGQVIGRVGNSYLGLSVGLAILGGAGLERTAKVRR